MVSSSSTMALPDHQTQDGAVRVFLPVSSEDEHYGEITYLIATLTSGELPFLAGLLERFEDTERAAGIWKGHLVRYEAWFSPGDWYGGGAESLGEHDEAPMEPLRIELEHVCVRREGIEFVASPRHADLYHRSERLSLAQLRTLSDRLDAWFA